MHDVATFFSHYLVPATGNPPITGLMGLDLQEHGIPDDQSLFQEYARRTGSQYPDPFWDYYFAFYSFKV